MAVEVNLSDAMAIPLETPCGECGGKGGVTNSYTGSRYPCEACDGTGYMLTEIGERVFALLRRLRERERFRSRPASSL